MEYIAFKQHYDRIKEEMANEHLLTFEEMVQLTKISPEVLKRTIQVLAPRFCLYKNMKGEPEDDDDNEDSWTLQEQKKDKDKEDKEDPIDYGLGESSSDEDEEILSFEDLVRLTGTHPFYLERCLCHLAIQDEVD